MPMKRKYIMVGMLCLASVCLTLAGYLWVNRVGMPEERLALSLKESERVFQKYINGDYDSARVALLNYIEMLDRYSSESKNPLHNSHASDAVFWLVRLANLEAKNHHIGEKARYLQEALNRCQRVGRMNCSEEWLRQAVERMDEIALKTACYSKSETQ
jgi:hypothetical protein